LNCADNAPFFLGLLRGNDEARTHLPMICDRLPIASARTKGLQEEAKQLTMVTVERSTNEFEEARCFAMADEKGGAQVLLLLSQRLNRRLECPHCGALYLDFQPCYPMIAPSTVARCLVDELEKTYLNAQCGQSGAFELQDGQIILIDADFLSDPDIAILHELAKVPT
jgi:hypothetical protein